jgi:hypothetical protein
MIDKQPSSTNSALTEIYSVTIFRNARLSLKRCSRPATYSSSKKWIDNWFCQADQLQKTKKIKELDLNNQAIRQIYLNIYSKSPRSAEFI